MMNNGLRIHYRLILRLVKLDRCTPYISKSIRNCLVNLKYTLIKGVATTRSEAAPRWLHAFSDVTRE